MAKKAKKPGKPSQPSSRPAPEELLTWRPPWLAQARAQSRPSVKAAVYGTVVVVGTGGDMAAVMKKHKLTTHAWQAERASDLGKQTGRLDGPSGPVWFVPLQSVKPGDHDGQLDTSPYAVARDRVGELWRLGPFKSSQALVFYFEGMSAAEKQGALVGLEMGSYDFKVFPAYAGKHKEIVFSGVNDTQIRDAGALGSAVNVGRHLVNMPPATLNPDAYAKFVAKLLKGKKDMQVSIWDEARLKKENMNLHLAVGQAAEQTARLVHVRYRPKSTAKRRKKLLAVVGKGITFDSGGLDMKPPAGMRLMKKDMGGSAAVVGLALWLHATGYDQPVDLYLSLAENAVSANAFHPGDIIKSRSGQTVEIHNTDAEGRLVMADALDVAVKQKGDHEPDYVVNVATLTGAIKVALGAKLFGLFSNDDKLAAKIQSQSQALGERGWRMPLFRGYEGMLRSHFADFSNAAATGFGGAITAGLFLEKFVAGKPWAHLDIYSWTDAPDGALQSIGGSGQGVQTLVGLVKGL